MLHVRGVDARRAECAALCVLGLTCCKPTADVGAAVTSDAGATVAAGVAPSSARAEAAPTPSGAVGGTPAEPAIVGAGPPRAAAVGETGHARDYDLAVERVQVCKVPAYFATTPGTDKLGLFVRFAATGEREVRVNAFYAQLTASDGTSYRPVFTGCTPDLRATVLTKGGSATGYISFEVPTGTRDFVLSYDPFVLGGGKQELRFEIRH